MTAGYTPRAPSSLSLPETFACVCHHLLAPAPSASGVMHSGPPRMTNSWPRRQSARLQENINQGLALAAPPASLLSMQFCHPELVRTFTTERKDNLVAWRDVHRHLKVVLEGAYQSMHLRSASINTDRRQLAP